MSGNEIRVMCAGCVHSLLAGWDWTTGTWRVTRCGYSRAQVSGPQRKRLAEGEPLADLERCPDTARAARFAGVGA
jgi:hypothetical protein